MMKKEELKQLALRIGNVPARYESNVEEYQEEERFCFGGKIRMIRKPASWSN